MPVFDVHKDERALTLTFVAEFEASADQLEKMLAMGMEEGMRQAMGQIDEVLPGAVPAGG